MASEHTSSPFISHYHDLEISMFPPTPPLITKKSIHFLTTFCPILHHIELLLDSWRKSAAQAELSGPAAFTVSQNRACRPKALFTWPSPLLGKVSPNPTKYLLALPYVLFSFPLPISSSHTPEPLSNMLFTTSLLALLALLVSQSAFAFFPPDYCCYLLRKDVKSISSFLYDHVNANELALKPPSRLIHAPAKPLARRSIEPTLNARPVHKNFKIMSLSLDGYANARRIPCKEDHRYRTSYPRRCIQERLYHNLHQHRRFPQWSHIMVYRRPPQTPTRALPCMQ